MRNAMQTHLVRNNTLVIVATKSLLFNYWIHLPELLVSYCDMIFMWKIFEWIKLGLCLTSRWVVLPTMIMSGRQGSNGTGDYGTRCCHDGTASEWGSHKACSNPWCAQMSGQQGWTSDDSCVSNGEDGEQSEDNCDLKYRWYIRKIIFFTFNNDERLR